MQDKMSGCMSNTLPNFVSDRMSKLMPKEMVGQNIKSAHTALAVKACLLGGNSNTKCSMTFVNIAVAISALAGGGGGAKNGFAPRPDPKNGFAPRPEYGGVFDIFRGFLGV